MKEKVTALFADRKKEQLVLCVLLAAIGIVILLPTGGKQEKIDETSKDTSAQTPKQDAADTKSSMEEQLAEALARIKGAGEVHVVLTLESSGKKIVEKDRPEKTNTTENQKGEEQSQAAEESKEEATVYEKNRDGSQIPYVIEEEYPSVRGVLIIAEGGDQPVVVQEIQEAVMALFQVGANKIKVVKMK